MYNHIKVYIVDDHQLVIEGLKSLLIDEQNIDIVGSATNAEQCLEYFNSHSVDVILMDISLPDKSGIDLCRIISEKNENIKIIALSTFTEGTYVIKMMGNGASGYLHKNASKLEIIKAIKTVFQGDNYLTPEAEKALKYETDLQNKLPKLTKREKEVLLLISNGLTNNLISEKLFISIDTVDSHRKNLYSKMNVNNTAMLIKFATENKLF